MKSKCCNASLVGVSQHFINHLYTCEKCGLVYHIESNEYCLDALEEKRE